MRKADKFFCSRKSSFLLLIIVVFGASSIPSHAQTNGDSSQKNYRCSEKEGNKTCYTKLVSITQSVDSNFPLKAGFKWISSKPKEVLLYVIAFGDVSYWYNYQNSGDSYLTQGRVYVIPHSVPGRKEYQEFLQKDGSANAPRIEARKLVLSSSHTKYLHYGQLDINGLSFDVPRKLSYLGIGFLTYLGIDNSNGNQAQASKQSDYNENSSTDKNRGNQSETTEYSNDQLLQLHQISREACKEYNEGKNDIQKSETFNQVNEQKRKIGEKLNWQSSNWKGNVMTISTNEGGDYANVVIVSKSNDTEISFEDERPFGIGSGGVSKSESVFNQLRNLEEGDPVIFSGELNKGEKGIEETSITERGSICAPEFAINLTNIKLNPNGNRKKSDVKEFAEDVSVVLKILEWIGNNPIWFFGIIIVLAILGAIGKNN